MNEQLTKGADLLLCVLYKAYLQRCKNGEAASDAVLFGGSDSIMQEYIPDWSTDKIDQAARCLLQKGMINALFADDSLDSCCITDDGIIYMENRFSDKLNGVIEKISKLRSILLG